MKFETHVTRKNVTPPKENQLPNIFKTIVTKDKQLDVKKIRKQLNCSHIHLVNNLTELTGMLPGGTSSLILNEYPILIDKSINDIKTIYISAAHINHSVKLDVSDLLKVMNYEVMDLTYVTK